MRFPRRSLDDIVEVDCRLLRRTPKHSDILSVCDIKSPCIGGKNFNIELDHIGFHFGMQLAPRDPISVRLRGKRVGPRDNKG
jgi:hypothetical protein